MQYYTLERDGEITYDGKSISWPTSPTHWESDVAMACRVAGGPTTTNPGVWERVTYSQGRFTGYIRPGVEARHLIMAIKQSGTVATVMGVEDAFRKFGLLETVAA